MGKVLLQEAWMIPGEADLSEVRIRGDFGTHWEEAWQVIAQGMQVAVDSSD